MASGLQIKTMSPRKALYAGFTVQIAKECIIISRNILLYKLIETLLIKALIYHKIIVKFIQVTN